MKSIANALVRITALLVAVGCSSSPVTSADDPKGPSTPVTVPFQAGASSDESDMSSSAQPAEPPPDELSNEPKVSSHRARGCAEAIAKKLVASPIVAPVGLGPSNHYWFSLDSVGDLEIAVDAQTCDAAFAPKPGRATLFESVTDAQLYMTQLKRARAVLLQDPGWHAHCQRLEQLRSTMPNLVGCISWVEEFPHDLCTESPPPMNSSDPGPTLSHQCVWRFYVGEALDTHANRHSTVAIDAQRQVVLGATTSFGEPLTPGEWRAQIGSP